MTKAELIALYEYLIKQTGDTPLLHPKYLDAYTEDILFKAVNYLLVKYDCLQL